MTQSRSFKVAILSSGKFLVTFTGLISIAFLSRLFTKEDYAAYRQTLLAYAFVAPLLALGLPQALYYFIPRDRENSRSILTGNLLLLFLMGGLFTVAMWCGGNELLARRFSNPAISRLLLIYSPYAMLALPIGTISACLMSCDRVKTLAIYNVTSRIFTVVLIISLVLIWRTPKVSIGATVLAELLIFVPAVFLMYRATAGSAWHPDKTNLWDQMKFSVPLGMAALVGSMNLNLDKIVVSSMCTPEDFAVYVNGAIEIPLIGILTYSVRSVILPDFVSFYKSKDYVQIVQLWKKSIVKCGTILIPSMVFLFFMAPQIMRVLLSARYEGSADPFRVLLLLLLMRSMSTDVIFLATNRNKLILIRSVISLSMNLCLNILFVRVFGYIGAAISTVFIAYIWSTPFTLFFIRRILDIKWIDTYPFVDVAKIILASLLGATVFVGSLFIQIPSIVSIVMYVILYSIITIFFLNLFGIVDIRLLISVAKLRFEKCLAH